MSAIGEKISDYTGKVTSATMTAAGSVINAEGDAGSFGTYVYTVTFGPAVDAAGETGPLTGRVQDFRPDGSMVPQVVTGVWRKSGHHQWEVKAINMAVDGNRFFFVETWDLATRSLAGTIYALEEETERSKATSVIGEKITDYTGKVTTTTVAEAGVVPNVEADVGPFGTVHYTETFGPAGDAAGETGPVTLRGQCFLADGGTLPFTGAGTWRKSGHHQWRVKNINLAADGQRVFVVEEWDLATRSTQGTVYALD